MRFNDRQTQSQGDGMPHEAIKELAKHLSDAQNALRDIEMQVGFGDDPRPATGSEERERIAREAALSCISERRARFNHFDRAAIFGEPSWAILLAVYVCQTRNEKITIDALSTCGQSAAISSRWLNILQNFGLLFCCDGTEKGGHQFVQMTDWGYDCMTRYLTEIRRA